MSRGRDEDEWDYDTIPIEPCRDHSIRMNAALKKEAGTLRRENFKLKKIIIHLLEKVSRVERCGGCGRKIYLVHYESGRWLPYEETGIPHSAYCETMEKFKETNRKKDL